MVKPKDGGGGGGGNQSVAPFLKKCYDMVDDESKNSIISWSQSDDSFVIWDVTQFSVQLLPKYFKHNNFSSFIRQLNIYGFKKIDTDRWEFSNDGFIRGQKHLLKNISRRKNAQGTDNQKPSQQDAVVEPVGEVERLDLWKEVENLKVDKNVVMQELDKLRQYQESAENKMLLLRDRLQGMEKNQQQMLSFLVMVMQYPEFLVQLLHPKENNWWSHPPGTILEQGTDDAEPRAPDGMLVRYNRPTTDMYPETLQHSIPSTVGASDLFMSPEFMKMFSKENIFSLENLQNSLVSPEFSDDGAWEQFISANPFLESTETKKDGEESTDAEEPQNLDQLTQRMEILKNAEDDVSTGDGVKVNTEQFQGLEYLTRQMDLLASESSHE